MLSVGHHIAASFFGLPRSGHEALDDTGRDFQTRDVTPSGEDPFS